MKISENVQDLGVVEENTNASKPYISNTLLEGLTTEEVCSLKKMLEGKRMVEPTSVGEPLDIRGYRRFAIPNSYLLIKDGEFLFCRSISNSVVIAREITTRKGQKILIWG